MKTKEEILKPFLRKQYSEIWGDCIMVFDTDALKAMEEYDSQKTEALKEALIKLNEAIDNYWNADIRTEYHLKDIRFRQRICKITLDKIGVINN